MLIGIDFDNTIAGYDRVFRNLALDAGLVEPGFSGGKVAVRAALRALPDGEIQWQGLQGQAYGARMADAELIDGVARFLSRCRAQGVPVVIVSHKTEYGHHDPARVSLRQAALRWMEAEGFFSPQGFGLARGAVHFESTRPEKVARIAALGCTHFIDDLPEVFNEPGYPQQAQAFLLSEKPEDVPFWVRRHPAWSDIEAAVLG